MWPRASARPLGTCAVSGPDPTLWPAQCCTVLSCHLNFGVTAIITSRIIMRGKLAYVSSTSCQFLPRSAMAIAAVAFLWVHMMRGRLPKCRVPSPSPFLFKCWERLWLGAHSHFSLRLEPLL
jgi:hypothetical protein